MKEKSKKRFVINATTGWVAQLVAALVGFVQLSYLVTRLGAQGYGIYQLAQSAIVFFMFLQLGMSPTLVRFFAKAVAKEDKEEVRKICSTAQFLLGSLGIFASLLCLAIIPFFIRFYDVPSKLVQETTWLLICMAFSLFLNINLIVPQGLCFSLSRYDLANLTEIGGSLVRFILIIGFFELARPSLFFVGFAILLAQFFRYVSLTYVAIKGIGKAAIFSVQYVTKDTIHSIFSFSMLNFANSVAAAVTFQGPVLIIGKVLGEEMVTAFAPALLIATAMQGFLGQTTRPLVPFASRDGIENGGKALGGWAVTMGQVAAFVGFGITLPLAIFGPEIMAFWLGENLGWIWPVVVVITTGVAISQVQAANYFLALGGGDIKPTVYSQIVMAGIVLTGTLIGTVWFEWQLFSVALFIGVCILVRNTFYLAFAYSRQFDYAYGRYLRSVYGVPALITAGCVGFGWGLKYTLPTSAPFLMFAEVVMVVCGYALISWNFLVPRNTKQKLIAFGYGKIHGKPAISNRL